jgi:hypothetical protein
VRVQRGHPAFPTPSLSGRFKHASDASRREGEVVCETRAPSLRAVRPAMTVLTLLVCFPAV